MINSIRIIRKVVKSEFNRMKIKKAVPKGTAFKKYVNKKISRYNVQLFVHGQDQQTQSLSEYPIVLPGM